MKLYPVTVISEFYENPDEIRKYALAQKYTYCHEMKDIEYVFPGSRTKELRELSQSLYEKVCKKLISAFHIPEHDVMRWQINTSFQIVEGEYDHGLIHQDQNTVFAGVLYLTPDAPLDSGTSLFRKNASYDEDLYWKRIKENDERFKRKEPIDFSYHEMFDEVVRVNNVYNSLILFEGDIHHCANNFFGKTRQDSRLAQVFFITKIDANKESSFPLLRVKKQPL
ncbi:DUF6445 family protein [Methylophilus medardicus]|uniref:2OG-Fe(II) oxygenase n=1 Tax=Methylophilus medardicus TaxID=2588534 RepID=A0A5B8CV28_9PROT|nr:DUF6445 family protein [Methylophilus medardicus]QDC45152.1 hypothetical protein FIU01_11915 [Methylophilus medardicus]QDC50159.1 hypothetical protein FIU00_11915 [Methylophilus medardicus]QDC53864.1 hypothetical protein FIT99_11915 [Methylophilus medardicus]